MKHYYAIFKKSAAHAVEVEFPDLQGCITFGETWEEALENAEDALAAWLAHADKEFVKEPSKYDQLKKFSGEIVPIPINPSILISYQKRLSRFNVIFPSEILRRIDHFRKKHGLKRSTFLQKAAMEYLQHHEGRV